MTQYIDQETLQRLVQAERIEALSISELILLFQDEIGGQGFLPDGVCQIDPRNNDRVLFNTSRARRPHDNQPEPTNDSETTRTCVVCQGHTTGIVDVAPLSQGSTFINKNLYPSLYPHRMGEPPTKQGKSDPRSGSDTYGSTLPPVDVIAPRSRLARTCPWPIDWL